MQTWTRLQLERMPVETKQFSATSGRRVSSPKVLQGVRFQQQTTGGVPSLDGRNGLWNRTCNNQRFRTAQAASSRAAGHQEKRRPGADPICSQLSLSGESAELSERGEALPELSAVTNSQSQNAVVAGDCFGAIGLLGRSPCWHAVRTSPRHEKHVYEHLLCRNIESFLPLYHCLHRWKNGCSVRIDSPLFPGYLFVKIGSERRVPVLGVPGVLGFVGTKAGPSRLEDFEIETLRRGLLSETFEPHSRLVVGDKVRVIAGPLAGLTGILIRNKNLTKVVITVELIQQSLAVQLAINDLEPFS